MQIKYDCAKIHNNVEEFQTPLPSSRGLDFISLIDLSLLVHCRVGAAAAEQYNI